jgi:very-short-patch-repair endonuclease
MKNTQIFARQLRRSLTPTERRLWYLLRNRRFACYKFRRQHPVGPYILDFACCATRLAIELDGGQHDEARLRCSPYPLATESGMAGFTLLE